jgi:hypothetical protein
MRKVVLALLATIAGEVTSKSLDVVVEQVAGNATHGDTSILDARTRPKRELPAFTMEMFTRRHRAFTCHTEVWRGLRIASPKM